MLERTSVKLYPIVREALKKMIEESPHLHVELEKLPSEIEYDKVTITEEPDMRSVLGYLNQNEWIYNLNIGNIM
jgi:regulator of replication initiation timing